MGGMVFVVADSIFVHGALLAVTLLLADFFVLAWFALRYRNANRD